MVNRRLIREARPGTLCGFGEAKTISHGSARAISMRLRKRRSKWGGTPRNEANMLAFRECLMDCGLSDLGYSGYDFTWNNRRDGDENIQVRLDRGTSTALFLTMFPLTSVEHIATEESDHMALLIKVQAEPIKRFVPSARGFMFEEMWLKHENYEEMVKEAWEKGEWQGHGLNNLWKRLHGVTKDMQRWSYEEFGSAQAEIKRLQGKLDAARAEARSSGTSQETGLQLLGPPGHVKDQRRLQLWLLDNLGNLEEKELRFMLMTLYQLWLAQNDAHDEAHIEDPSYTARRTFFLVEWVALKTPTPSSLQRPVEHWIPPAQGWAKVNVDGAFSKESDIGGGGVILRDHHGGFISGACNFFSPVSDPERAELLACRQGLKLAQDMGLPKVLLETDFANVVAKLKGTDMDRSIHGPLVEEIKVLLQGFEEAEEHSPTFAEYI
ncbi:hypothetical protein ACQ4PT_015043 [Festuca glaucescens]